MLVVVILVGGMTMDAKTTKKKSSKSSSSATLNGGDIPSAVVIVKLYDSNNGTQLKKCGYKEIDNSGDDFEDISWIKSGVCKINYTHGSEAGDDALTIEVYDSSKRTNLYNELKKYLSKKKGYSVYQSGNQIILNRDY